MKHFAVPKSPNGKNTLKTLENQDLNDFLLETLACGLIIAQDN